MPPPPTSSHIKRKGITKETDEQTSISKNRKSIGNASSRNKRKETTIKGGTTSEEFTSAENFDFTKPVDWLLQSPLPGPMTR